MLEHLLRVKICDQKRYVIALKSNVNDIGLDRTALANLDGFPPQYEECLCSLFQEPCELVNEYILDFVRLLDLDADTYTVDARFYEDLFIFIAGDRQRI